MTFFFKNPPHPSGSLGPKLILLFANLINLLFSSYLKNSFFFFFQSHQLSTVVVAAAINTSPLMTLTQVDTKWMNSNWVFLSYGRQQRRRQCRRRRQEKRRRHEMQQTRHKKVEWAENAARGDFLDLLKTNQLRRKHFSRSRNFFSFLQNFKMLSLKDTKSNHQRNLKDADVLQNNQKQEQASDLEDSHRQTEACSASSSVTSSSLSTSTSSREHGKRQRQSVSFQTGLRRAKRRWSKSRDLSARVWLESWKLRQKVLKLCR